MANFSTHRSYTVPRVANALTLTVVGIAVWWSGAQRPAPMPQQMARATAVAQAPTPARPESTQVAAAPQIDNARELGATASLTTVAYVPGTKR